jgi:hypothetical protein
MDWLLERQDRVQKKLASRHLPAGGMVLYDLSSSYFEGSTCPLAKRGYNRDGKGGKLQVNYGLLTDPRGCPVAVSVFEGNTSDSKTFMPAVHKLRDDFGVKQMVMVGDRGMVSQKAIDAMREDDGIGWITALKTGSIRALVEQGHLQMGLFDERNLLEIESPDFPGERLVACRNEALTKLRAFKREDLLAATELRLTKIKERVDAGKLVGADVIGLRVGKIINQFGSGRPLHHPHLRAQAANGRPDLRAQLQVAGQCRARLPIHQDDRSQGTSDPPPNREPGSCPHLPVHVGLLRRVAHARGLARVDVRRHGAARQGDPRPSRTCPEI